MKKIPRLVAFVVCLPLIGTVFVKPDKGAWKTEESEEGGIDERFVIRVEEDIGPSGPESGQGLFHFPDL